MCEKQYTSWLPRLLRACLRAPLRSIFLLLILLLASTQSVIASGPNSVAASIERLNQHLLTLEQKVNELESLLSEHEQLSNEQEASLLIWRLRHETLEQSFNTLSGTFETQVSLIEAERDAEAARAQQQRRIGRIEGAGSGVLVSVLLLTLVLVLR